MNHIIGVDEYNERPRTEARGILLIEIPVFYEYSFTPKTPLV
jgi:hypothetical protein